MKRFFLECLKQSPRSLKSPLYQDLNVLRRDFTARVLCRLNELFSIVDLRDDYLRKSEMIIKIWNGQTFDTQKDLTAPERHILQKLFAWESMADTLEEFREKKDRALNVGWNNSGPVDESHSLSMIIKDLEKRVVKRLRGP